MAWWGAEGGSVGRARKSRVGVRTRWGIYRIRKRSHAGRVGVRVGGVGGPYQSKKQPQGW